MSSLNTTRNIPLRNFHGHSSPSGLKTASRHITLLAGKEIEFKFLEQVAQAVVGR
jgi:hypothetical protein